MSLSKSFSQPQHRKPPPHPIETPRYHPHHQHRPSIHTTSSTPSLRTGGSTPGTAAGHGLLTPILTNTTNHPSPSHSPSSRSSSPSYPSPFPYASPSPSPSLHPQPRQSFDQNSYHSRSPTSSLYAYDPPSPNPLPSPTPSGTSGRVSFAEEVVKRVVMPDSNLSASAGEGSAGGRKKSGELERSGTGVGSGGEGGKGAGLKGFFGGWKRKSSSSGASINTTTSAAPAGGEGGEIEQSVAIATIRGEEVEKRSSKAGRRKSKKTSLSLPKTSSTTPTPSNTLDHSSSIRSHSTDLPRPHPHPLPTHCTQSQSNYRSSLDTNRPAPPLSLNLKRGPTLLLDKRKKDRPELDVRHLVRKAEEHQLLGRGRRESFDNLGGGDLRGEGSEGKEKKIGTVNGQQQDDLDEDQRAAVPRARRRTTSSTATSRFSQLNREAIVLDPMSCSSGTLASIIGGGGANSEESEELDDEIYACDPPNQHQHQRQPSTSSSSSIFSFHPTPSTLITRPDPRISILLPGSEFDFDAVFGFGLGGRERSESPVGLEGDGDGVLGVEGMRFPLPPTMTSSGATTTAIIPKAKAMSTGPEYINNTNVHTPSPFDPPSSSSSTPKQTQTPNKDPRTRAMTSPPTLLGLSGNSNAWRDEADRGLRREGSYSKRGRASSRKSPVIGVGSLSGLGMGMMSPKMSGLGSPSFSSNETTTLSTPTLISADIPRTPPAHVPAVVDLNSPATMTAPQRKRQSSRRSLEWGSAIPLPQPRVSSPPMKDASVLKDEKLLWEGQDADEQNRFASVPEPAVVAPVGSKRFSSSIKALERVKEDSFSYGSTPRSNPIPGGLPRSESQSSITSLDNRYRMTPSSSIQSLLSLTMGHDGLQQEEVRVDDVLLPMFRVIPATPVIHPAEEFEAALQTSGGRGDKKGREAKALVLEDAAELLPSQDGDEHSDFGSHSRSRTPKPFVIPETAPLVPRSRSDSKILAKSTSSNGPIASSSSSSIGNLSGSTSSLPSLSSMNTVSSSSTLSSLGDVDQLLNGMLASLDQYSLQSMLTNPLQAAFGGIKAKAEDEPKVGHEADKDGAETPKIYGLGLGFDSSQTSPPPRTHSFPTVRPLQPRYNASRAPIVDHKKAFYQKAQIHPKAVASAYQSADDEPTPRPDSAEKGFEQPTRHIKNASYDSVASSAGLSSRDSISALTETDSISSDMDDLGTASISVVDSRTSAIFASPLQLDFKDFQSKTSIAEESDENRWEDASDDEIEIGWAM